MATIDLRDTNYPQQAADNIIKIINAKADADKSNTELKKQLALDAITRHRTLQSNQAELQQGNQAKIDMKSMNMNWLNSLGGGDSTPGTPSDTAGVANSQTANNIGGNPNSPVPFSGPSQPPTASPVQPPAINPNQPPISMVDPSQQPANNAAQPQVPPGITIPSPIGKPLPPPKGKIGIGQDGKPTLNQLTPDDQWYQGVYNQWKSGQPLSADVQKTLQDRFNSDNNGNPVNSDSNATPQTPQNKFQSAVASIKKNFGPQYTLNPDTGELAPDPIYTAQAEAKLRAAASHDERQPEIDFQHADTINKLVNPTVAPTRSVLGIIGQTTVRAQRAIDILNNPNIKISPQMLAGIGSDMAGILQGGSPTQVGMSEQQYSSLQSTIAKAAQYLTAKPQDALPPALNKQLLDSFQELNNTGKKYIQNNIKSAEILHKDWVSRNQDTWNELKSNINDQYGLSTNNSNATNTYKVGDTRVIGGKTITRDANGNWS